jgi:hypothetical protein
MDDDRELWSGQSVYLAGGGNDHLTVRVMDAERRSVLKHRRPSEILDASSLLNSAKAWSTA